DAVVRVLDDEPGLDLLRVHEAHEVEVEVAELELLELGGGEGAVAVVGPAVALDRRAVGVHVEAPVRLRAAEQEVALADAAGDVREGEPGVAELLPEHQRDPPVVDLAGAELD